MFNNKWMVLYRERNSWFPAKPGPLAVNESESTEQQMHEANLKPMDALSNNSEVNVTWLVVMLAVSIGEVGSSRSKSGQD